MGTAPDPLTRRPPEALSGAADGDQTLPRFQPREREEAFAAALGAIRRKERSVAELERWMGERDLDPEITADVIGELVEVGELDDARFAHAYAEDKRELSGWGPERIAEALIERGIERGLAESACAEDGHEEQLTRATGLVAERFGDLEEERERARALAFLGRRGYQYELSYEAIREARRPA